MAAKKDMGMSWASIKHMILDTITHAFCSSATKERVRCCGSVYAGVAVVVILAVLLL